MASASRCSTATSSGYPASTSIAFRSTTKYMAAPRAVWRHPWLTCSMERGREVRGLDVLRYFLEPPLHPSCTPTPALKRHRPGGRHWLADELQLLMLPRLGLLFLQTSRHLRLELRVGTTGGRDLY
jgi:hypothetical protein